MPLVIDDSFARAVDIVLSHEGGFADKKGDRGGPTNFGISLKFLELFPEGDINKDGMVDRRDVELLTRDQAIDFYWREFWNKFQYGKFNDWCLATKVFDLAVNMGPSQAHCLLQQALLALGIKIIIDGKLGTATFRAANNANRDALLAALRAEAAGFYRLIARLNPGQDKFLTGWLNRAYS